MLFCSENRFKILFIKKNGKTTQRSPQAKLQFHWARLVESGNGFLYQCALGRDENGRGKGNNNGCNWDARSPLHLRQIIHIQIFGHSHRGDLRALFGFRDRWELDSEHP
jgi:hypothetical protein